MEPAKADGFVYNRHTLFCASTVVLLQVIEPVAFDLMLKIGADRTESVTLARGQHACMNACVHACSMYVCVHACMRACVRACLHACTHSRMEVCMHACVRAGCMRACVHACMRACVQHAHGLHMCCVRKQILTGQLLDVAMHHTCLQYRIDESLCRELSISVVANLWAVNRIVRVCAPKDRAMQWSKGWEISRAWGSGLHAYMCFYTPFRTHVQTHACNRPHAPQL